jgi:glycosyltransferase involved in cell wall biosynthesis
MVIARALERALREAGLASELIVTPQNRFGRQGAAYLANWLTDVGMAAGGPIDQVISLRFPSYAVRHRAHVCWLNHTMREYYDLWERFTAPLTSRARIKERVRRAIILAADRLLLRFNVHRLFVQSKTIQARLDRFIATPSEVLYPPPPQRAYRCDEYGDYIFAVSRLTPLKRMDLIVAALARPEASGIRAIIAGDGEERRRLEYLIEEHQLGSRVRLVGAADDHQLVEYLARCRAVCFTPFDEDYGLVTVEAFAARKPVVTCVDSGGPTELVADGVTGLTCRPDPDAIAHALRRLTDDAALATRLGEAGHAVAARMTWPAALEKLLVV